jgi:arginine/ornithine N-succinyltransferase beta subunit
LNSFPEKFPNDEDGQALKMLYKEGVDFKTPQYVDFFVAVPNKKNGESILTVLRSSGFNCELEQDDESEEWTCYCIVEMLLIHEDIINIQKQLNEACKPYNGYSDGWGVMSN